MEHHWPYGSGADVPMTVRGALLDLHARFCRPWLVPVARVVTYTAWTIAVVLMIMGYAAAH